MTEYIDDIRKNHQALVDTVKSTSPKTKEEYDKIINDIYKTYTQLIIFLADETISTFANNHADHLTFEQKVKYLRVSSHIMDVKHLLNTRLKKIIK